MRPPRNSGTQPIATMPVFNNWDVVARAWYLALPSNALRKGGATSIDLCGQRVALFRGEDGRVRALDAFCPHMGTDLGIGKVQGNELRCFFHHWRFNDQGECTDIPCLARPAAGASAGDGFLTGHPLPRNAKLQAYATEEKYGYIWVYPDVSAPHGVVEFDEFSGHDTVIAFFESYRRNCHHHVNMINGIDPQHLRTVHGFNIEMALRLKEDRDGTVIDFILEGAIQKNSLKERLLIRLMGPKYSYSMRYADASIGLLTMMRDIKLFNRFPLPRLHMIFAFIPVSEGETRVQPIFVTRKRGGIYGWLVSRFLLWVTRVATLSLVGEDGKVYDNMRFYPKALLPIDAPVAKFIAYVNRLKPSVWSRQGELKPGKSEEMLRGSDLRV